MSFATYSNMTHGPSSDVKLMDSVQVFLQVTVSVCFCLFLFFISLILHVYRTAPHIREHARYILFAHMLINDTLYLADGLFLLLATLNLLYLPVPVCFVIVSLASVTFRITPYNLAAMALERYTAICFPLRHVTLCTSRRSNYAIATMWFVCLMPNIIDFIMLYTSVDKKFFSLSIICKREHIIVSVAQSLLNSSVLIINLISAGLIITATYIRVMCIAKNMSSRHGSAQKAGNTVLLHAVQFLLCLFSLTSSLFEAKFRNVFLALPTTNFLIFMCLPRFLSPLIYGLRDQMLSKCIKKLLCVKLSRRFVIRKCPIV
ncbi:odorant receptor 131-2-like [Phyllobates terribilis]|uniref:odorant receptor 131-2-like n=1 Tax=Phyllobates terribilis TaxID=111132 RepID=UPI003CCAECE7